MHWRKCLVTICVGLAAAMAWAAPAPFEVSVLADGATLGTAAAKLDVTVQNGSASWKMTDGRFAPAPQPEAKVAWDDAILSGSGIVPAASEITIKDFTVMLEQSTGVDISYRFRMSATMDDGVVKSVSITQLK